MSGIRVSWGNGGAFRHVRAVGANYVWYVVRKTCGAHQGARAAPTNGSGRNDVAGKLGIQEFQSNVLGECLNLQGKFTGRLKLA